MTVAHDYVETAYAEHDVLHCLHHYDLVPRAERIFQHYPREDLLRLSKVLSAARPTHKLLVQIWDSVADAIARLCAE